MWYFCKYKDFLGKPGEGLRRYRFLNLSLVIFCHIDSGMDITTILFHIYALFKCVIVYFYSGDFIT